MSDALYIHMKPNQSASRRVRITDLYLINKNLIIERAYTDIPRFLNYFICLFIDLAATSNSTIYTVL